MSIRRTKKLGCKFCLITWQVNQKSLALAFGLEANYDTVKQKLVEKYRRASRLDDGELQNIFHATRKPDKSYKIFAIRLPVLAAQWRDATDSNHQAIVWARFLYILEPVMLQRVNTQFGHKTFAVELQRIVDFVSILETLQHDKAVTKAAAIPPVETAMGTSTEITVMAVEITHEKLGGAHPKNAANTKANVCDHCRRPWHLATVCRQKLSLCFNCHKAGHFANVCPNLTVGRGSRNSKVRSPGQQQCPVCRNWGHAPWQCDLFWKCMMACQRCGSRQHTTAQCTTDVGKDELSSSSRKAIEPPAEN